MPTLLSFQNICNDGKFPRSFQKVNISPNNRTGQGMIYSEQKGFISKKCREGLALGKLYIIIHYISGLSKNNFCQYDRYKNNLK